MQGAMVAGLAETAAEDLADHLRLLGTDVHVVTEIEVRYLAQNRVSPIVSQAWVVGRPAERARPGRPGRRRRQGTTDHLVPPEGRPRPT